MCIIDFIYNLGTTLQEINVDCEIDDKASIVSTKKGKAWEVK